jgi:BirA family biotin operon repressor/biotin-[acetyl-CoA-carboxylase] ligase
VSEPPPERAPPALGAPRLHFRLTDSTNARARALALAGAPHGTLVTASEQSAGRGRQGRKWSAPAGSALLASLVLREMPGLLPLAAALAVCDVAGEGALIKWPNDVVVPEPAGSPDGTPAAPGSPALAKLSGILLEGRPQEGWVVLGIGLNVAVDIGELPAELQPGGPRPAATMGLSPEDVEPILGQLLGALEHRLREPASATLEAWRARDALAGREIAWASGSGIARGIDGAGRLVVEDPAGGRTTLAAGEVHLQHVG